MTNDHLIGSQHKERYHPDDDALRSQGLLMRTWPHTKNIQMNENFMKIKLFPSKPSQGDDLDTLWTRMEQRQLLGKV